MNMNDYIIFSSIFGCIATILGWWLKTHIDSSVKHEYDKLLELFKSDQKRSDTLLSERLVAFKYLSEKLLALRRYCNARSAEIRNQSEFETRTEALSSSENISLLQHHEIILRALEEKEYFFSPNAKKVFNILFSQISMGFNLELYHASSSKTLSGSDLNAHELYDLIVERVNDVIDSLYEDLGLNNKTT
jgi:hypothetical protein